MHDPAHGESLLTDTVAQFLLNQAIDQSSMLGLASTIVIVDHAGAPKTLLSMDGAPRFSVALALGKARTAAQTASAGEIASPGGLVPLGGGFPLLIEGQLAGAIGISGEGHYSDDMAIGRAALAALQVWSEGAR